MLKKQAKTPLPNHKTVYRHDKEYPWHSIKQRNAQVLRSLESEMGNLDMHLG